MSCIIILENLCPRNCAVDGRDRRLCSDYTELHTSLVSRAPQHAERRMHSSICHFICDKRQDPGYVTAIRDPENKSSLSPGISVQTNPGGLLCEKIISKSVALITLLIFPIPYQPPHRWASTVSHTPAICKNAIQFTFMQLNRQAHSTWNLLQAALLTGKVKAPGIMTVCQLHWALLTKTGINRKQLWTNAITCFWYLHYFIIL